MLKMPTEEYNHPTTPKPIHLQMHLDINVTEKKNNILLFLRRILFHWYKIKQFISHVLNHYPMKTSLAPTRLFTASPVSQIIECA